MKEHGHDWGDWHSVKKWDRRKARPRRDRFVRTCDECGSRQWMVVDLVTGLELSRTEPRPPCEDGYVDDDGHQHGDYRKRVSI